MRPLPDALRLSGLQGVFATCLIFTLCSAASGKICPLSIYLILQLNPSAQANPAIINYAFLLIR
ncbi:hypothetical protein CRU79_11040 [Escherichia sp. E4385]|nr:hypothetical protein CRU79_11040 [Escherichia sp. E4385]